MACISHFTESKLIAVSVTRDAGHFPLQISIEYGYCPIVGVFFREINLKKAYVRECTHLSLYLDLYVCASMLELVFVLSQMVATLTNSGGGHCPGSSVI